MGRVLVVLLLVLLAGRSHAGDLVGRVSRVIDGDTFTLVTEDRRRFDIRLAEIDAPEADQPFAAQARRFLAFLILRKEVRVRLVEADRHGRFVGQVWEQERWINGQMVRSGAAWVSSRHARSARLLAWEEEAREARRGLWSLPEHARTPPWDQRRQARAKRPEPASASPPLGLIGSTRRFRCGEKRLCREMTSCEEAMFHLRTCGVASLDRDGNGIPCESLCRR
ncbi:MAG: thermonuclease family protein [Sphingomonadaceae bacterium]